MSHLPLQILNSYKMSLHKLSHPEVMIFPVTNGSSNTKKILTLFLSLLFCFIFAGCNFGAGSVLDIATKNGLEMLHQQAIAAWDFWHSR